MFKCAFCNEELPSASTPHDLLACCEYLRKCVEKAEAINAQLLEACREALFDANLCGEPPVELLEAAIRAATQEAE